MGNASRENPLVEFFINKLEKVGLVVVEPIKIIPI